MKQGFVIINIIYIMGTMKGTRMWPWGQGHTRVCQPTFSPRFHFQKCLGCFNQNFSQIKQETWRKYL